MIIPVLFQLFLLILFQYPSYIKKSNKKLPKIRLKNDNYISQSIIRVTNN